MQWFTDWGVHVVAFKLGEQSINCRLAQHKHAIRAGNLQCLMVLCYREADHSSCTTLQITGMAHTENSIDWSFHIT